MNEPEMMTLAQPIASHNAFTARIFPLPGLLPEHARLLLDTSTNVAILLRLEGTTLASSHRSFRLTPAATRLLCALLQHYPTFCSYRALFLALYPLSPEPELALAWDRDLVLRPIRRAVVRLLPMLQGFGLRVISLRGQGYALAGDAASTPVRVASATTTEKGNMHALLPSL